MIEQIQELLKKKDINESAFMSQLCEICGDLFAKRRVKLKGRELEFSLYRFFLQMSRKAVVKGIVNMDPFEIAKLIDLFTEKYGRFARILLYSGGVDSFVAYFYVNKPRTLYVDLQHRYSKKEKIAVGKTISQTRVIRALDLGSFEEEDANIPMRNLYLAMITANTLIKEGYDVGVIYIVIQRGEMNIPDRSDRFFKDINHIIKFYTGKDFEVVSPFREITKVQLVKWYVENVGDVDRLRKTIGCYSAEEGHCGKCSCCFRRSIAFAANGIPLDNESIKSWEGIPKYIERIKKGEIEELRSQETLEVLRQWGYQV